MIAFLQSKRCAGDRGQCRKSITITVATWLPTTVAASSRSQKHMPVIGYVHPWWPGRRSVRCGWLADCTPGIVRGFHIHPMHPRWYQISASYQGRLRGTSRRQQWQRARLRTDVRVLRVIRSSFEPVWPKSEPPCQSHGSHLNSDGIIETGVQP